MSKKFSLLLGLMPVFFGLAGATGGEISVNVNSDVVTQAAADACKARIVFLGGPASHGSAKSLEFEGALVEKLISRCQFNHVVFEAPIYDLLDIQRRLRNGGDVSKQEMLDAVGGIWSDTREFQDAADFLAARLRKKTVVIDGMADHIGATGDYVNSHMASELASYLPKAKRDACLDKFETHINWKYDAAHPYTATDKAALLTCLHDISNEQLKSNARDGWIPRAVIASLTRYISRDFIFDNDWDGGFRERDRSMAMNFELLSREHPATKTIVWGATIHLAKSLKNVSGGTSKLQAFGPTVIKDMGLRPFVIATSALSGTEGRAKPKPLPTAPADSLEVQSFQNTNDTVVYKNAIQLSELGSIPARIVTGDYTRADWQTAIDALVVFKVDTAVSITHK